MDTDTIQTLVICILGAAFTVHMLSHIYEMQQATKKGTPPARPRTPPTT